LSVEGYYKKMSSLYEYRDGADLVSNEPLELQLTKGTGVAYGVEALLQKRLGALSGWLGYTLSWTRRSFPELNNGLAFYPTHDRRHDISVFLSYRAGRNWVLGATWEYASGQPYSSPTGTYLHPILPGVPPSGPSLDYGERNAHRLPAFHKLDLSATFLFSLFDLAWQASVVVYNAYNRRNVYAQYVTFTQTGPTEVQPVLNQVILFSITPTLGLAVTF
jgi:hypothetical protein